MAFPPPMPKTGRMDKAGAKMMKPSKLKKAGKSKIPMSFGFKAKGR